MIAALLLAAGLQHWLVVNDIHLDPFSKAGVVRGADTTPALWKLAVPEMRDAVPQARVVVLGGDLLAHHFPTLARDARTPVEASVLQTDRAIADDLDAAFPHAQFLLAQGNNDDPCGDYRSETTGAYMRSLAAIWAPLIDRHGAAPDFTAQFVRGGYYTARLPFAGGEAVVLNSDFWSIVYTGGCLSHPHDPGATELQWLTRTLDVPGRRVVVVMHIPPGYDPESTMLARRFLAVPFLKPGDDRALIAALNAHPGEVRAAIGAHTHRYDFRVAGAIPMLIASSISPIYNNNPAFYDVSVDDGGNIVDVQPYVYDLFQKRWERKPSFDAMYGVPAFTAAALTSIDARIMNDPATRQTWETAYDVWSWRVGDLDDDWLPFACAQTHVQSGYASCAHTTRRTFVAEIVLGCIVVMIAGWLVVLIASRR